MGNSTGSKKSSLKSNTIKGVVASAVAAVIVSLGFVIGSGSGEVCYTELDSTRTNIEIVTPPEGMDSNNYSIFYNNSRLGSSFYRSESSGTQNCGVSVLSGLLDKKSNFVVRFYDGDKEVGNQRLDKFKEVKVADAAVIDNGIDLRMQMLGLRNFKIYSVNKGTDRSNDQMSCMIYPKPIPSDYTNEWITSNLLWLDQWQTYNSLIDTEFSYSESRFPELADQLYLYSNFVHPCLVIDIPDVKELTSKGVGVIFDMIPDNTVRAGNDIYDLNGSFYSADKIIESRQKSGSSDLVIWYKINGKWFDLLDSSYNDSSYFDDDSNAISESELSKWETKVNESGELYYNIFDGVRVVNEIEILK